MPPPFIAGAFFFSAWLTMIFWGIIAPDLGIPTISYTKAMLVTIAIWLVNFPLALVGMGKAMGWKEKMRQRPGEPMLGPMGYWRRRKQADTGKE